MILKQKILKKNAIQEVKKLSKMKLYVTSPQKRKGKSNVITQPAFWQAHI